MKNLTTMKYFVTILTVLVFGAITLCAQDIADDEIIRVDTNVGQISVAIEQTIPAPFNIEVLDNGVPAENVRWESPSKKNPVQVIIVVAMNPVDKWRTDKDGLEYQIKTLEKNSAVQLAGIKIVNDVSGFGEKLDFPKSYNARNYPSLQNAVTSSLSDLSRLNGNRKALLLLTNEVESLPIDVIETTSAMLGQTSLMVYLMSVNEKGLKEYKVREDRPGKKQKIIARSNINGIGLTIRPDNFLGGMFNSFLRLASNLYTVSYDLSEDLSNGATHKVQVNVKRVGENRPFTKNIREFRTATSSSIAFTNASYDGPVKTDFIRELAGSTFDSLLQKRAPTLSSAAVDSYEEELKNRPEFKGVKILSRDNSIVTKLKTTLDPVLKIYGRDNYTRIIVYEGENPFIGLYRESILLFSTKGLDLLSDKEKQSAVAHELAHEIYINELAEADRTGNRILMHQVEFKCDLVSVLATAQLIDDPYAVTEAANSFSKWYEDHPAGDIGQDRAPTVKARKDCIKAFLVLRGNGTV